ncbi:aminoglycoside phosphotransferase family protein [Asanoa sp. WMMD1127]|uniref:phosphotransferase family protein n=1 Tax=Asanoa sp. WMMD1127 TaxID=3016107 RepID=UPI002416CBA4|nr:aminoglycoside phosphotransferase family protein [Asanoa sp. WMMD1127]MDG4824765.1 aminoglycoside phosphotransferase family protein [Asanoa sp. WMMD1127]
MGAGYDHAAYEVNAELVVRLARTPDPAQVDREAAILAAVRAATDVPVPEPIVVDPDAGLLVYRKLQGVPAATLPDPSRVPPTLIAALRRLMRDIEAITGAKDDDAPPSEWLDEARTHYGDIRHAIPATHHRAVELFLSQAPPPPYAGEPVFCHNDLGIEHVLVDPATRTLTGVIDWADAARTEPAHDLGRLFRDLGPRLGTVDDRALFFARCTTLEDLHYGLSENQETYARNALAALGRVFP